jgi:hypothetical protein
MNICDSFKRIGGWWNDWKCDTFNLVFAASVQMQKRLSNGLEAAMWLECERILRLLVKFSNQSKMMLSNETALCGPNRLSDLLSPLFALEIASRWMGLASISLICALMPVQRPLLFPIRSAQFFVRLIFPVIDWSYSFSSSGVNWNPALHQLFRAHRSNVFFSLDHSILFVPSPFLVVDFFFQFILIVIHPSGHWNQSHCRLPTLSHWLQSLHLSNKSTIRFSIVVSHSAQSHLNFSPSVGILLLEHLQIVPC